MRATLNFMPSNLPERPEHEESDFASLPINVTAAAKCAEDILGHDRTEAEHKSLTKAIALMAARIRFSIGRVASDPAA
jgi:hypothetical protein